MRYTYTTLAIMATSLAVSACNATIGDDTPKPCETAGCKCARTLGADLDTSCASDLECGDGQWCMVTCTAFHAVEPAGFCAPLRSVGEYCSHIGGDHECASQACDTMYDVCAAPSACSSPGNACVSFNGCAGSCIESTDGSHTVACVCMADSVSCTEGRSATDPCQSIDGNPLRGACCVGEHGPGVCGGHTVDGGPLVLFPICIEIATVCTSCPGFNDSTCGECVGAKDAAACNWCGNKGECHADVCYPVEAP